MYGYDRPTRTIPHAFRALRRALEPKLQRIAFGQECDAMMGPVSFDVEDVYDVTINEAVAYVARRFNLPQSVLHWAWRAWEHVGDDWPREASGDTNNMEPCHDCARPMFMTMAHEARCPWCCSFLPRDVQLKNLEALLRP